MTATLPCGSLAFEAEIEYVIAVAAVAFNVPEAQLTGGSQRRPLTAYRQIAMAAARQLGHSFWAIATAFDRDHTTVMHACRKVAATPELATRAAAIAEAVHHAPRRLF